MAVMAGRRNDCWANQRNINMGTAGDESDVSARRDRSVVEQVPHGLLQANVGHVTVSCLTRVLACVC